MSKQRRTVRRFVVFEGIDGSGTSTQLGRLDKRLSGLGVQHSISFEPTDGPVGRLIRQALSGNFDAHPDTVARLFAADRGEHLYGTGGILELTGAGSLVISDRYLFSSLAYQGLACASDLPLRLNADFPLPELLLFFSVSPDTAMDRVERRKTLEIYENRSFQEKVASAYGDVIRSFEDTGMRIVHIDAAAPPDAVEEAVWKAVSTLT